MKPTVVITSKDRRDELARAISSVLKQTIVPEVVVFDDGSSDGTFEMVRERFPSVRCLRSAHSKGIVAARNAAIPCASGDIVFTMDDDCVMESPETIARTLRDFDHPQVGAVAIPHIDVLRSSRTYNSAPDGIGVWVVSSFAGGASAIRRGLFEALGGYSPAFFRESEEYDFSTRLLDCGYVVRCGTSAPLLHYASPRRNGG